ncbi:restriction endonuclease [Paraburkholderia fungorum]|uniref:restriction endonuclease n=1 Tax=Paraburkholderia fungorum TaxID=134537 RepID=UPI0004A9EF37|nr:restriction endonuclease [Paraburkholderia fungorum]KFX66594.1 hypothetical protein KBK24_0105915 [Burkholderia sp. K24]USX05721.1 restriction endonuclease [Paraburkholderia fungorum]
MIPDIYEPPLAKFLNRISATSLEGLEWLRKNSEAFDRYREPNSPTARELLEPRQKLTNDQIKFLVKSGQYQDLNLDIPNPAYQVGYNDLLKLSEELIDSHHKPSIVHAMRTMESEICYFDQIPGSKAARVAYRLNVASQRLACFLLHSDQSETLLHSKAIEVVRPSLQYVSAELIAQITKHPSLLRDMEARTFERVIAEILRDAGFDVELTAKSKDGGYDIFAVTANTNSVGIRTSFIVECKRNSAERKIGVEIARQLFAVKEEKHASNAILVTTSDFTKGVYDYKAKRMDFDIRNFEGVVEWCQQYHKKRRR